MTVAGVVEFLRERVIFAKLAAIILWICYVGSIVLGSHSGTFNWKGEVVGADHLAWYTAARLIVEGHPEKVYNYEFVADYQRRMIPEDRWQSLMAYRNPPFYCLLYLPTCQLPFTLSWFIWSVVYLIAARFAVGWLGGNGRDYFWLLAFYPTFAAISYGQNSLISFVIFAGTYRLLKSDRIFLAGMVAGLLWFKPTLLPGLILWGLLDIRRLWPAALGVLLTGTILTAGSYPLIPQVWAGFYESLWSNVKFDNFEQFKMHNPLAFWRLLLPEASPQLHWRLAGLTSLLAVGWFVAIWRKYRHDRETIFGAMVFATLWGSPHALIYEWTILGVTGVLWWPRLAHVPSTRFLLYGAVWVIMFVSTAFSELQLDLQGPPDVTRYAVQFSVLVLAVAAVWGGARLRKMEPPTDGAVGG